MGKLYLYLYRISRRLKIYIFDVFVTFSLLSGFAVAPLRRHSPLSGIVLLDIKIFAVIPESTSSCRRSAWSAFPPLCSDQSSAGTVRQTVYRRRPGLPGRRTHHLEQPAGQRDICPVSVNLPSASKTFLFQASFPDIIIDPR